MVQSLSIQIENISSRIQQFLIIVLAGVYTTIQSLVPSTIRILPGLDITNQGFGLFVLATGAMIFGKGVGAGSAGLGVIFDQFKVVLDGSSVPNLNLGLLVGTVSLGLGAWLTGFLENGRTGDFVSSSFKGVMSKAEILKVGRKTLVSIVGLGITSNFTYAFGAQLIEGGNIFGAITYFLTTFLEDSFVLILTVPISLLAFDITNVYNEKKSNFIEQLNQKVDYKIEVSQSAEILKVSLPETSLVQGKWTPVVVEFMNPSTEKKQYQVEAVFTTKFYPHTDKTPQLKPGEGWKQTFFVLPSKQSSVYGRIRITSNNDIQYKSSNPDESIVEITANSRDPNTIIGSLIGLSGVNFGILGISVIWDQVLSFFSNPELLLSQFQSTVSTLSEVIFAEILLFISLLLWTVFRTKKEKTQFSQKISFSSDLDDQLIQSLKANSIRIMLKKYGNGLTSVFRVLIGISSLGLIIFLGNQGYQVITNPTYTVTNQELLFGLILGMIISWVLGFRGLQIITEMNLKNAAYNNNPDDFVQEFKPVGDINENEPNNFLFKVINTSDLPGIRIKFESTDSIAPPLIELHIEPGEIAQFKVVVTPNTGNHKILALAYPLFDKKKKYVNFDESEPFAKQELSFAVNSKGVLGMSKKQQSQLKGITALLTGFTGLLAVINQIVPGSNNFTIILDNLPALLSLQIPILGAYFSLNSTLKNWLIKSGENDL